MGGMTTPTDMVKSAAQAMDTSVAAGMAAVEGQYYSNKTALSDQLTLSTNTLDNYYGQAQGVYAPVMAGAQNSVNALATQAAGGNAALSQYQNSSIYQSLFGVGPTGSSTNGSSSAGSSTTQDPSQQTSSSTTPQNSSTTAADPNVPKYSDGTSSGPGSTYVNMSSMADPNSSLNQLAMSYMTPAQQAQQMADFADASPSALQAANAQWAAMAVANPGDTPSINQMVTNMTPAQYAAYTAPATSQQSQAQIQQTVTSQMANGQPVTMPSQSSFMSSPSSSPQAYAQTAQQAFLNSPGYQFSLNQALASSAAAASAGGYSNSPAMQYNLQQTAAGLASTQYQNYVTDQLGAYTQFSNNLNQAANLGQQSLTASSGLYSQQGQDLASLQANNTAQTVANNQWYGTQDMNANLAIGQANAESDLAQAGLLMNPNAGSSALNAAQGNF